MFGHKKEQRNKTMTNVPLVSVKNWNKMNAEEFRRFGKEMINFIADYIENARNYPVLPSTEPGYLQSLIPCEAPEESEKWDDIMKDVVKYIIPGMTHWQSPHFHAYFPAGQSYPSILGELLSAGLGTVEFTWVSNPISTELEVIVMDWLGKLIGLPGEFLNCSDGKGGGIIQGSASETVFVCLLAAKQRMLKKLLEENPNLDPDVLKQKMVAYSSDQSNSCVEKAGRLGSMKMRLLKSDKNCRLRGDTLLKAIKEDLENGLVPTYLCATLGTTPTCAFDRIDELSPICKQYGIWIHVDAAYAGAAFICPEYRHLMKAVDTVDSFNMNPHKWLLVNFDCSAFWIKNSNWLIETLNVDRIYLDHHKQEIASARDHRNWEIPLGRRFRSLKLWFTLRSYGAEGLQKYIRYQIYLAKEFEKLVISDNRFEIPFESSLGLICFRLKGPNSLTKNLLNRLTHRKKIYVVAGAVQETIFIRFIVGSKNCELEDIHFAWKEIQDQASEVVSWAEDPKNVNLFEEKSPSMHYEVGIEIENFFGNGFNDTAVPDNN